MAERADQRTPSREGVVPIIRNGVLEGACGVNGGTTQQDEDCARAGVARL
jgi:glc operon protein GlcG